MVCKKCGAQLREFAKFCDECGEKIPELDSIDSPKNANENLNSVEFEETSINCDKRVDSSNEDTLEKAKNKKKLLIIGIIAFILVLGFIIFKPGTSKPNTYTTENVPVASSYDIAYIGNRRVQYNEAEEQYVVFFSFSDATQNNYIAGAGTAEIVITETTGNELYNRSIKFTEKDFTNWTNQMWDGERLMCGLYINKADILGSASSTGNLTLKVYGDNFSFDADTINIYELPMKGLDIRFPEIPYVVTEYDYYNNPEFVLEVQDVDFEVSSNYDAKISGSLSVKVKMLTNNSDSSSSYSHVSYKLKNSEGIVVNSGSILINPMSAGEIAMGNAYLNDLNPNDSYILTFENTK